MTLVRDTLYRLKLPPDTGARTSHLRTLSKTVPTARRLASISPAQGSVPGGAAHHTPTDLFVNSQERKIAPPRDDASSHGRRTGSRDFIRALQARRDSAADVTAACVNGETSLDLADNPTARPTLPRCRRLDWRSRRLSCATGRACSPTRSGAGALLSGGGASRRDGRAQPAWLDCHGD